MPSLRRVLPACFLRQSSVGDKFSNTGGKLAKSTIAPSKYPSQVAKKRSIRTRSSSRSTAQDIDVGTVEQHTYSDPSEVSADKGYVSDVNTKYFYGSSTGSEHNKPSLEKVAEAGYDILEGNPAIYRISDNRTYAAHVSATKNIYDDSDDTYSSIDDSPIKDVELADSCSRSSKLALQVAKLDRIIRGFELSMQKIGEHRAQVHTLTQETIAFEAIVSDVAKDNLHLHEKMDDLLVKIDLLRGLTENCDDPTTSFCQCCTANSGRRSTPASSSSEIEPSSSKNSLHDSTLYDDDDRTLLCGTH